MIHVCTQVDEFCYASVRRAVPLDLAAAQARSMAAAQVVGMDKLHNATFHAQQLEDDQTGKSNTCTWVMFVCAYECVG